MSLTPVHGQVVFGGPWSPVGWCVGFVDEPLAVVRSTIDGWREPGLKQRELTVPIPDQLRQLLPLEAPFTRRLVVATRSGWTAHFDNSLLGGDPAGWIAGLTADLDCRGIVAQHIPRGQYPYPATQFCLLRRSADGHWEHARTVAAGIFDSGRWIFEESGLVQPFEETAAYRSRLKRDRLTREMLLRYLAALGIAADERDFYGNGVLYEEAASWKRRTLTLDEARREYGWSVPPEG
jgi:hypothetical protein